ncbi:MAG: hypothetical protein WC889_20395, partial [Myxococcota bacterium]
MSKAVITLCAAVSVAAVTTLLCACGMSASSPNPGRDGGGDAGPWHDAGQGFDGGSSDSGGLQSTPPFANAGPDREVLRGQFVTLNGLGSSTGSDQLSWEWQKIDGPQVWLSNNNDPAPVFVAPLEPCTLTFRLKVGDRFGSDEDTVIVDVVEKVTLTSTPLASAGGDLVIASGTGTAIGSGSTATLSLPLFYHWL